LLETLPRLDFIVNNACQTVRRPPEFYAHMMEGERATFMSCRRVPANFCGRMTDRPTDAPDSQWIGSDAAERTGAGCRTFASALCSPKIFCRRRDCSRKAGSTRICNSSTCGVELVAASHGGSVVGGIAGSAVGQRRRTVHS
jgi:hypothetical protein